MQEALEKQDYERSGAITNEDRHNYDKKSSNNHHTPLNSIT